MNLQRFANGDIIIDGIPERVVEPIDFGARLGARFEFAGFTKTVRGNSGDDDDAAFVSRLRNSSEIPYLRNSLLDMLP